MRKITNFSTQKLMTKIMAWGTTLLFFAALGVMAYLSFVTNIDINPSIRNITIVALVALVLNYVVWDSRYKADYDKAMTADILNEKYSIHRRYYFARKGLKQTEVQAYIRQYNKDYVQAWLDDVVDETGRTIEEIVNEPYKGHDHKFIIWRIKHHKYPKSGLKRSREVLSVLSVSGSDGMKIDIKKSEHQHAAGRIRKLLTSLLSTFLAASLAVNFVQGDLTTAFLTLLLNVVILFSSLFFGALAGIKGAKVKLATAEQISELLEEWRKQPPKEEPYQEPAIALNGGIVTESQQQIINQKNTVTESQTSSIIELT